MTKQSREVVSTSFRQTGQKMIMLAWEANWLKKKDRIVYTFHSTKKGKKNYHNELYGKRSERESMLKNHQFAINAKN